MQTPFETDPIAAIGRSVSRLSGYAPALPTPFDSAGAIDESAFAQFCDRQMHERATALVVCGTTGEAPTLTPAEHSTLIRAAVEVAHGRVPVIAGAGSNSTAHAIELTRHAEAAGADAVLSVVPYYNKPTQPGLTCSEHVADTVLWPKLAKVLPDYPDIKVELFIEHSFTDIAAERFDAGVRLGESVERDMIAVRIGPDGRLVAVASPRYLKRRSLPETPQDLVKHSCINLRLASQGGLYAWEFEKDERPLRVRVDGQLIFNTIRPMVNAALAGFGIAFVPEDSVVNHIKSGKLVQILDAWCPPVAGFHLYYPSRRQSSPAFQVIADALRYRP